MKSSNHRARMRHNSILCANYQMLSRANRAFRFMAARTLYDKLWTDHVVREEPDGTALLTSTATSSTR